jgi:hypothetical protein
MIAGRYVQEASGALAGRFHTVLQGAHDTRRPPWLAVWGVFSDGFKRKSQDKQLYLA